MVRYMPHAAKVLFWRSWNARTPLLCCFLESLPKLKMCSLRANCYFHKVHAKYALQSTETLFAIRFHVDIPLRGFSNNFRFAKHAG